VPDTDGGGDAGEDIGLRRPPNGDEAGHERGADGGVVDLDLNPALQSANKGLPVEVGEDAGPLPKVHGTPYDPEPARDNVRANIAYAMMMLLFVTILGGFAMLYLAWGRDDAAARIEDLSSFIQLIFPPVVAVVGSVTGFYFGASSGRGPRRDS